jgi:hypothetical protein
LADRTDFYFRQRVTEAELDLAFELLERADRNLAADLGVRGIVSGATPAPHEPVADLTIDLTAPARAYDRLGQRIFFGTGPRVDCSTDHAGLPTEVPRAGEERWLGVFLRFDRALSDPRTDGNSREVYFRRDESFEIVVRQGPAATAGRAPRIELQPDELLVCEVLRRHGQTQILAGDIDTSRREVFVLATGDAIGVLTAAWHTLAPAAPTVQGALDAADLELTRHFDGSARRHRADHIDLPPRHFVASMTVQGAIHELLDRLVSISDGSAGASRIGADAVPGRPHALPPGTVDAQLSQTLDWLNAHVGALTGAHHASAIGATPHRYIAGASVQAQLEELVADLDVRVAGAAGASRIGAASAPGTPRSLPAGTVEGQLLALLAGVNNVEQYVVGGEWTYPSPRRRTALLTPDCGADATRTTTVLPGWVRTQVSFTGGVYFPLQARTADASWIWQLRLPAGAILRAVRALVRPGVARSTLTTRMSLRLWSAELRFVTGGGPTAGRVSTEARDNGSITVQALDVGALTEPLENATRVYYAQVSAGTPSASDLVYGLAVDFDEPGPRSH